MSYVFTQAQRDQIDVLNTQAIAGEIEWHQVYAAINEILDNAYDIDIYDYWFSSQLSAGEIDSRLWLEGATRKAD